MDEEKALFFRKEIQKFISLSDEDWQLLVPHLSVKKFKRHTQFATEGKVAKDIGLVMQGSFRQFYSRDGEEFTTYFFFEPHLMSAYISCITNKPSLLTIEALEDSTVIVFPYKVLQQLFDASKAWEKFGRMVAEYAMMGLEERMVGLLILSPEERYLQLLNSNKTKILERIPQHHIANYLGITAVSLSRIRNRISKK